MSREHDLVLWGATGFTGRLVAEYLRDHAPAELRWAMGGRSRDKLERVRREIGVEVPLVVGDSLDRASLDAFVARTRAVVSTVGPYTRYGSPLVDACAAHGTHYCDLTGETPWIRRNVDLVHDRAFETGARIVHCCGFDSIPSDLGVLMLQDFARRTHGAHCSEVHLVVTSTRGGFSGGTVASMVEVIEAARRDPETRRVLLDPYALNPPGRRNGPDVPDQRGPQWEPDLERWTAPFLMAPINTRVVRRTNALLDDAYGRDFRYTESMATPNRAAAWAATAVTGALVAGVAMPPTRWLLQKLALPAPGEGPSREKREAGRFRIKLVGWTDGLPRARVLGRVADDLDPGYASTAKMLSESAMCLALDELDCEGGVLTPAACMGMTLVERLRAAGMTFSVEDWPA